MKADQKRIPLQSRLNAELSGLSASSLRRECLYQAAIAEGKIKKGSPCFPSRTAFIIALLILSFAATAFAFTRPAVLSWLIGNDLTSPQLETTVQAIMTEHTAAGITLRITGIVFDGEKLAFSYELENDQPTMPVMAAMDSSVLVDGQEAALLYCTADPDLPQMVPRPHVDTLPVKRNPASGGGLISIGRAAQGMVTCEMTFIVYQPENQLAVILMPDGMLANAESYSGSERAEALDSLNTLKSFQKTLFIEESHLQDDRWLSQGNTVINEDGTLYDLMANSHLKEVAQIKLTFAFDASLAFSCDFAGTADIAMSDCILHVEQFRLSALETSIDLWLLPPQNTKEAAQSLAEKYADYHLTDEQGLPVQYSGMDYMADMTPYVTQMDGQWVCRCLSKMPGLLRFPQSVAFHAGGTELVRFDLLTEE